MKNNVIGCVTFFKLLSFKLGKLVVKKILDLKGKIDGVEES